jgi:hypothetical protein
VVGSKLKVALLVLLLFGAPALVTAALLSSDFGSAVADGAQPGGEIDGTAVDPDEHPVAAIDVSITGVKVSGERGEPSLATTDAAGRFALHAPPVQGHYEIRTGGGDWQKSVQAYSLVDTRGQALEKKPLRIVLRHGCRLELEFMRNDGRASGDGDFTLQGEYGDGLFFGLVKPPVKISGAIKAGTLELAGLPPMKANLFVRMASGETIELTLDLAVGVNKKRIRID